MNSIKLAEFFSFWIDQTIQFKNYIEEVQVNYIYNESYSNYYIRINYMFEVNEAFYKLTYQQRESIIERKPYYIFSLSTNAEQHKSITKREMLRVLEFKHIYESLTANAILELQRNLKPNTPIKIESIEFSPEANYAENYFLNVSKANYWDERGRFGNSFDYQANIAQWSRLHELSKQSRKIFLSEREQFSITDNQLNTLFYIEFNTIRYLILKHNVAIQVKGIKIIKEVLIHVTQFVQAIKNEININESNNIYKRILEYFYSHQLKLDAELIIQRQKSIFLQEFPIQKGDIVKLKDNRIVIAESIDISADCSISLKYSIMKKNLHKGERTKQVSINKSIAFIKEINFHKYVQAISVRHISLLEKWMNTNCIKIEALPLFKPKYW